MKKRVNTICVQKNAWKVGLSACLFSVIQTAAWGNDYLYSGNQNASILQNAILLGNDRLILNGVTMGSSVSPLSPGGALPSLISLGGDNNTDGQAGDQNYGNLTIDANGGSLWGTASGNIMGIYTKTLTVNSTSLINSSADIDLISTGGNVVGIRAENGGSNGSALINLTGGTINIQAGTGGINAAVYTSLLNSTGNLAKITVSDNLLITTDGMNAIGLFASVIGTGDATIDALSASGLVITTKSASAHGIFAQAATGSANASVANANITTGGDNAYGIYATTSGNANSSINLAGSLILNTTGTGSNALWAYSAQGDAVVDISLNSVLSGSQRMITTTNNYAHAINVQASGFGSINAKNLNIETSGQFAHGIFISGVSVMASITNGSITTGSSMSDGIHAESNTDVVDISLINTNITTSGSDGIYAKSANDGSGPNPSVKISVDGDSVITANAVNSHGIYAIATTGTGNVAIENLGVITIGSNALIGASSTGAGIRSFGTNGTASITNGGSIETYGITAYGIRTGAYGNIGVTNNGSITTHSNDAYAIFAESSAGTATLKNNSGGSIVTEGGRAYGIYTALPGNVIISNDGSITTSGAGAHGIYVNGSIIGTSVMHAGTIITTGNGAYGIYTSGSGSLVKVNLEGGSIQTIGSSGIYTISSHDGSGGTPSINISLNDASSILIASGSGVAVSNGIYAETTSSNGTISIQNAGNMLIGTEGSSVVGTDEFSAIRAQASYGNVTIVNDGSIQMFGHNADGITVQTGGNITITNNGSITIGSALDTNSVYASGILARGSVAKTTVLNTGKIETFGQYSNGIDVLTGGEINVTLGSGGSIVTRDAYSNGIYVQNAVTSDITVTIEAETSIITNGPYSHGIYAVTNVGKVNINNQANITSTGTDIYGIFATINEADNNSVINIKSYLGTGAGNGIIASTAGIAAVSYVNSSTGGSIFVDATGDISGVSYLGIGVIAQGDDATATVKYDSGTITVASGAAGAIIVGNQDTQHLGVSDITIGSNAIIQARNVNTVYGTGVQSTLGEKNTITIESGAQIYGAGKAAVFFGNNGTAQENIFNNSGYVDSTTVGLFVGSIGGSSYSGSEFTINNLAGATIQGSTGIMIENVADTGTITNYKGASIIGTGGTAIQIGAAQVTLELQAGSTLSGNIVNNNINNTLVLSGASADSGNLNGNTITGTNAFNWLRKTGDGTWSVSGAMTLSATSNQAVNVQGGTFNLNNATITTSGLNAGMTVTSGASLSGNGTINGNLMMDGILSPGNSAGLITVNGNVSMINTSIFVVEIASSSLFDRLLIDGNLTIQDGAVLTVSAIDSFLAGSTDSFQIIEVTGNITGEFIGVTFDVGGAEFFVDYRDDGIWLTQIPEPSSYGILLGLGFAGAAILRRRRKVSE